MAFASRMTTVLILLCALFANSPAIFADQASVTPSHTESAVGPFRFGTKTGNIIFGAQFGYHYFDDGQLFGSNELRDRADLDFRLGYAIIDHLDFEATLGYVPSLAGNGRVDHYNYFGHAVGNLFHNHWWTPYASFGAGGYVLNSRSLSFTVHEFAISYAGGLKIFFLPGTAFRMEARGITAFDIEVTNFEITGGLVVYADLFGKDIFGQRDRDGDGIYDKDDKCPDQPEDRDGFEDADGCPDLDNDQDGIADSDDRCFNQPEDKDGFQDEDGCPDLDNDGDGIADDKDKCPNEPEDKDGFQDEDGCPEGDNDKDGIADAVDKCPTEPENYNDVLDEDGCPDEDLAKFSGSVPGIKFALDSEIIDLTSYPVLDEAARILNEHKDVLLTIEGHTDSTGTAKHNLLLSKQRAESVRQYLIAKGVSPFRIRIAAFGEERPVASNATETGRAINRRIEFKLELPSKPKKKPAPAKKSP